MKKFIVKSLIDKSQQKSVEKSLSQLQQLTKDLFAGEETSQLIGDLSIFLLRLFLQQKHVMNKHVAQLKIFFGEVSSKHAAHIHQTVLAISEHLSEDSIEKLHSMVAEDDDEAESTVKKFGNSIKIAPLNSYAPEVSLLHDMNPVQNIEDIPTFRDFSMKYDEMKPSTSKSTSKSSAFDQIWLAERVESDLLEPLIAILKSPRSSEELQNELFELMGFDKFELIQEIFVNRKQIVKSIQDEVTKDKARDHAAKMLKEESTKPAPNYLMPVLVQSDKEKELMRQVRKDEKSCMKKLRNVNVDDEQMTLAQLKLYQSNSQLHSAQHAPLLSRPTSLFNRTSQPVQTYPNVFDSSKTARAHVGFLTSNKIMLPEDTVRKDHQMYEEVTIPASETPADLKVGDKRVQIESLDDIGQMAFQGMKELNRIQTIVYPTAYHTNENLLICAPTGAGKTNVAMLAVVNCIRAHTDQGMIHRDQFKVVYVAPMKALAAEMTESFGKRLKQLGISVRELTGDMQLTKAEMQATQMLVTTPEKWDVVTRKGSGDATMISQVKLLIIDEVHLLHGERGPVVEALVARTLRLVESSQSMIRIVGLSATLPNYIDVARFLRVNPMIGLFFFDSRFRPIPLSQQFIGVKALKQSQVMNDMNTICYNKCLEQLRNGKQVMVFVHARNATTRTAMVLREMAQQKGHTQVFSCEKSLEYANAMKLMSKSRNHQLVELFQSGFGFHHAGMLRSDRSLVEKLFGDGVIKVLVCTATLAWGVNLPGELPVFSIFFKILESYY